MADMMDTLKGLLGDNADEKLNGIMQIINSNDTAKPDNTETPASSNDISISPEMLLKAQSIMNKISSGGSDDRTKLLMSLKPYMRKSRQDTIDNAIKMLNMVQISQLFKEDI